MQPSGKRRLFNTTIFAKRFARLLHHFMYADLHTCSVPPDRRGWIVAGLLIRSAVPCPQPEVA